MQVAVAELEGPEFGLLELESVKQRGRLRYLQPLLLADPYCYRFAIPSRRIAEDLDSAIGEGFE